MKPMRDQRNRKRERGSETIEATLVLMLFLISVFSLFDFGFTLFLHQSFVHEARMGARYGAINPDDLNAIKNMVLYSNTTGSGTGYMGLAPSSVTIARNGTSGGPDDRILVTISGYHYSWITPGLAGRQTGAIIAVTVPVEN
jgi:hypothetical protein